MTSNIANGAVLHLVRNGIAGYEVGRPYTVLSASGGVSGTYSLTGDTSTAFVRLFDRYDANNVYLVPQQVRTFSAAAITPNQIATAAALDATVASDTALHNAVSMAPNDAVARQAFDLLSGDIHASVQGAMLQGSHFVRDALSDRLRGASASAPCAAGASGQASDIDPPQAPDTSQEAGGACALPGNERVAWAHAFGSWGRLSGDGNAATLSQDVGGVLFGVDSAAPGGWQVGFLGGYSRANANADDRASSSNTDTYLLGGYGGRQWGDTALRLGASHAWNKIETHRQVAFPGFADSLAAKYDSTTTQVFGGVG